MAKGDPKPRRAPRTWCIGCKKTLQDSAFRPGTGKKCLKCFNKAPKVGPKFGEDFEASVVKAEAERNIRAMREEWALR